MSRALEAYRAALSACPQSGGGVHAWILGTANHAAAGGVDAAQAVAEITASMTRRPSPAGEVRDTVARAYREAGARVGMGLGTMPPPPRRPKSTPAPKSAADFIRRGAGVEEVDFWEASPVRLNWGDDWRMDACALLRALFLPGELVFCGDTFGKTVRPRDEWVARFMDGEPIPPLLCPNPLKAGGGMTAGGKPSPRCDDAVAVFRHAVAEFDSRFSIGEDGKPIIGEDGNPKREDFPLESQFAFWWGWGLDAVTAVTFSGSKSLHVLFRVDCAGREEWNREIKNGLFRRRLIPLGCDGACANPSRLTRLAGAVRADKGGAVQKLLFVREELR